ncbi:hypothetical protein ACFLVE_04440, partial [Chloroflexota bacterium]
VSCMGASHDYITLKTIGSLDKHRPVTYSRDPTLYDAQLAMTAVIAKHTTNTEIVQLLSSGALVIALLFLTILIAASATRPLHN